MPSICFISRHRQIFIGLYTWRGQVSRDYLRSRTFTQTWPRPVRRKSARGFPCAAVISAADRVNVGYPSKTRNADVPSKEAMLPLATVYNKAQFLENNLCVLIWWKTLKVCRPNSFGNNRTTQQRKEQTRQFFPSAWLDFIGTYVCHVKRRGKGSGPRTNYMGKMINMGLSKNKSGLRCWTPYWSNKYKIICKHIRNIITKSQSPHCTLYKHNKVMALVS